MTTLAHRLGKICVVAVNVPKWPDALQLLFPKMSRGELLFSLIIGGLITTIACIALRVLPQLISKL